MTITNMFRISAMFFGIILLLDLLAISVVGSSAAANESSHVFIRRNTTHSALLAGGRNVSQPSPYKTSTIGGGVLPLVAPQLQPDVPRMGGRGDATSMDLYEKHLERTSFVFGLTRVVNASTLCHSQLQQIRRAILRKEPWAMKVLDASGSKPSGFVFGQNFWLGSREACGAVKKPMEITLSRNYERVMHYALITDSAPFDIEYRVVYLRHNSPWQVEIKLMSEQIIHIGLCLPSACSSPEIHDLAMSYLEGGLFIDNDIYDIRPEVAYVKDLKLSERFYERPTFKILSGVLCFTAAMILVAAYMRVRALELEAVECKENVKETTAIHLPEPSLFALPRFVAVPIEQAKDFAKCFDIIANMERLCLVKEKTANDIPLLNGLRSISAFGVLVFHVMWFMYFTVNNKPFLISYGERIAMQYISSAPLLVDVFFTISGFLQVRNFLRNKRQIERIRGNTFLQNTKLFCKLFFHRYLRLAPLYMAIICVVDLFYAYIGEVSVFHLNEPFDEMCGQYWWRNVFFIQNLFPHTDMCLNWTWSLACDMQYFLLATILLLSYVKRPQLVKSIVVLMLIGTISWSCIIGINTKFQLSFDAAFATGTQIYISPFVRVLPYILGACTAWLFHEKLNSQFEMSETVEKCAWNLSLLVFVACIYSTVWRDMSPLLCTALFVFGRFFFSACICWMIVGSATGRTSWWSQHLEATVFQHINRLSYAIYLLNPFVIAFFFSLNSSSTHADPFMLCIICTGFAVICYLISFVFALAFEIPYCNWSVSLLRQRPAIIVQGDRNNNTNSKPKIA